MHGTVQPPKGCCFLVTTPTGFTRGHSRPIPSGLRAQVCNVISESAYQHVPVAEAESLPYKLTQTCSAVSIAGLV